MCSFKEEYEWYVDKAFSHHISRDNNELNSHKKNKDGKVILGNSAPVKGLGKGNVDIDNNAGSTNVLLVQGLKKNILSVGLIDDKGHTIVFTSTK